MIINQATLRSVFRGFKVIFSAGFEAAKPLYQKIATVVPSNTKEEDYKWLGKIPKMREWIGDRQIQNLAAYGYTVKNKDWEATVAVDRNDIEDDTIGIYEPLIQSLADSAARHPDELVFDLLKKGFTQLCYDGQYFFDSDHKDGNSPIQSNRGNGKLTAARYATARATMMSYVDDQGRPMRIMPNLLVVSPMNEEIGRKICYNDKLPNGEDNPWRGSAELLVVPDLADTPDYWFLMDVSKPIKPIIFQSRKKPQFNYLDDPNSETVFMKKEFLYGVDSRDNAGYGLWQLCYGSTGEVA